MGKINASRVILGGLVAGLIVNVGEIGLNVVLADQMMEVMATWNIEPPGIGAVIAHVIMIFLVGIALVFMYAAIRPRFGAGARTAILAGVIVWFLAGFVGTGQTVLIGLFPPTLMGVALAWILVEMVVAALVGAWLYKEA